MAFPERTSDDPLVTSYDRPTDNQAERTSDNPPATSYDGPTDNQTEDRDRNGGASPYANFVTHLALYLVL